MLIVRNSYNIQTYQRQNYINSYFPVCNHSSSRQCHFVFSSRVNFWLKLYLSKLKANELKYVTNSEWITNLASKCLKIKNWHYFNKIIKENKQSLRGVLLKMCSQIFSKIHNKVASWGSGAGVFLWILQNF